MTVLADKAQTFRALHVPGQPLLMPNPWDAGTAKLLASLGFQALATTSGGHAATLGRLDGAVERGEALGHAATIVAAVDIPVSADLENGFADDPDAVFVLYAPGLTSTGDIRSVISSVELLEDGSYGFLNLAAEGRRYAAAAFTPH
ncbi:MAG TPA: isocitrate lyase/phosphoenolpyruvate mutase family protein [Pseudonocardiaceae bacterium]|nr:isocitrate lyase/phosphoenolpyruvate mutase family protein [Pseudonocardiaceae bacterium]